MKHQKFLVILAVICLLAGSAYAVTTLIPAVVDENKCLGCGACVEKCPNGAMALDNDGFAVIDKEKCTGCLKCAKVCPNEAISAE
jgi:NAD-dependent dihydropyrimidine dehydrogenase PreA subunit